MFKLSPLLIILLPISQTLASENDTTISNKDADKLDKEYGEKDSRDVQVFLQQCYQMVPPRISPDKKFDKNNTPVGIDAEGLRGLGGEIIYEGNVNLTQGDKSLSADSLSYNRKTDQASAKGNAVFKNGQLTLNADQIDTNLKSDESTLVNTKYQFHGQGGRGSADSIHDNGKDIYEFKNSSYTACPPNDSTWSIDSSTLEIDNNENMGTAYNAILRIEDVPVFYFPYISYPLTDTRKTGFLFPSFEYSSVNGITMSQPLYINIAPEQDMTITPTYMNNRGTLLATEYRYLFGIGEGTVQGEYIGDDKLYSGNDSRYLVYFDHSVEFAKDWAFNAEYTRVSDNDYFSDIGSDYGSRSENQLLQTAKLSYTRLTWESELEVRNFQILNESDKSHIVLPKLAYSAYQPLTWRGLQFDWYSEITHFDHSDDDVYTGTRLHMEPKITLPLYYNSMFIDTEFKYMISYYQQDLENATRYDWYDDLEEQVSRYLPSFKVHSGINLERDFSLFEQNYRQTLIPQVQYLYVPYKDQSNIGIYDTTKLQQDYYGLFRDNIYSGYDRIANANQLTIGLSTSFLNAQGKEKLRFAVGQNYYISQSDTVIPSDDDDDSTSSSEDTVSRSSVIGEFDINFANDYFLHAGMEWDSDDKDIQRANTTFEKRWQHNTFLQLSYRYYRADDDAYWYEEVNQVGSKLNWSINSQWTTFASYYYDLSYSNTFESIVGVKYQSCCWAIGLTYDEHMKTYTGSDYSRDDIERERSISLNIELMGLGGVGEATSDQGLFDYGRPFYLK